MLLITTIGRNPYTTFPFDRFTLGEALSLSSVSFRSVLYFLRKVLTKDLLTRSTLFDLPLH